MNIKAVPISKLFVENEDLYEKIIVAARRQKQIINSRTVHLEAFEEIEDTEQLEEFEEVDYDIDKPLSVAMKELFNGELEWTYQSNETNKTNE